MPRYFLHFLSLHSRRPGQHSLDWASVTGLQRPEMVTGPWSRSADLVASVVRHPPLGRLSPAMPLRRPLQLLHEVETSHSRGGIGGLLLDPGRVWRIPPQPRCQRCLELLQLMALDDPERVVALLVLRGAVVLGAPAVPLFKRLCRRARLLVVVVRRSLVKAIDGHLPAEVKRQEGAEKAGTGVHVPGGVPVVAVDVHGGVVVELGLHELAHGGVYLVAQGDQRAGAPLGGVAPVLCGKLGVWCAHLLLALVEAAVHIVLDAERGARADVPLKADCGRVIEADPGGMRLVDDLAHAGTGQTAGAADQRAGGPVRVVGQVRPCLRLLPARTHGGPMVDAPCLRCHAETGRGEACVLDGFPVDALELGVEY
mmetsp:Transcript_9534/g.24247  ORF Transcript_9534/g.24247 Transcript_9534/m.24247 type:complete len:369 (+) Transcript_9534:90-1196(+)